MTKGQYSVEEIEIRGIPIIHPVEKNYSRYFDRNKANTILEVAPDCILSSYPSGKGVIIDKANIYRRVDRKTNLIKLLKESAFEGGSLIANAIVSLLNKNKKILLYCIDKLEFFNGNINTNYAENSIEKLVLTYLREKTMLNKVLSKGTRSGKNVLLCHNKILERLLNLADMKSKEDQFGFYFEHIGPEKLNLPSYPSEEYLIGYLKESGKKDVLKLYEAIMKNETIPTKNKVGKSLSGSQDSHLLI